MQSHCMQENNKAEPVFGFVVPVYKTPGVYIEECVNSLLAQTYKNIQIVIVNDASPDNSGEVCEEIAKKDPRIKVVHHEVNGGLPVARNTGIDNLPEADWIAVIDSDDWVEPDMCEKLLQHIQKEYADVYMYSGFRNIGETEVQMNFHYPHEKQFTTYEERELLQKQLFLDQTKDCVAGSFPIQSANNRLYSAKYLREKNVRFIKVRFAEDALTHMHSLEVADKVIYLQYRFYHYRDTPGSMTNGYRVTADAEQLSVVRELVAFAEQYHKSQEFVSLMHIFVFMSMQMCVWQKYFHPENTAPYRVRKKACMELFKNAPYDKALSVIKNLPLSKLRTNQIIKYYLMKYHCYGLLVWLRNRAS